MKHKKNKNMLTFNIKQNAKQNEIFFLANKLGIDLPRN